MRISDWSSDVCSSDLPTSLSVQDLLRPPLAFAPSSTGPKLPPTPALAWPFRNHDTVMSSAARRDSPNWHCRVVEASLTSLKAVPMMSLLTVPLTVSEERPWLSALRIPLNRVNDGLGDSWARLGQV